MSHLFDDGSVAPGQCSTANRAERFRLFAERIARQRRRLVVEETAASMAEYALVLSVVALALVLVISQFVRAIDNTITRTNSSLATVADGNGGSGGDEGRGSCGTPPCGRGPNGDGPPGQDP